MPTFLYPTIDLIEFINAFIRNKEMLEGHKLDKKISRNLTNK